MNGIEIRKKKLSAVQIQKLKLDTFDKPGNFCKRAKVSEASMRKARNGKLLSEQIIDKIIKAL